MPEVGGTARVRDQYHDRQPNSAGLVVQLAGVIAVLVIAIVGLGAIVVFAIGAGDDDDDGTTTEVPSTIEYTAGADLAAALECVGAVNFDGGAHVEADASIAPPDAFQCTLDERPVFGYVYLDAGARQSALDSGRLSTNLCTSFPADSTQPDAPTGFETVIGSNWLLATRDAAFADDLDQRLGSGGVRNQISCTAEG